MKNKAAILLLLCLALGTNVFAQDDKEDRKEDRAEKKEETKARIKDKTDYTLFHRQMLSLKEYSEERRKIPALQKANKTVIKVIAIVDTGDDDAQAKTLTGYIVQNIGDNSTNVYEVTFDRAQKKITAIKHTPEAVSADKADKEDEADDKKDTKKTIHKKTKDDDDDDDDAPAKGKDKDEDKE